MCRWAYTRCLDCIGTCMYLHVRMHEGLYIREIVGQMRNSRFWCPYSTKPICLGLPHRPCAKRLCSLDTARVTEGRAWHTVFCRLFFCALRDDHAGRVALNVVFCGKVKTPQVFGYTYEALRFPLRSYERYPSSMRTFTSHTCFTSLSLETRLTMRIDQQVQVWSHQPTFASYQHSYGTKPPKMSYGSEFGSYHTTVVQSSRSKIYCMFKCPSRRTPGVSLNSYFE